MWYCLRNLRFLLKREYLKAINIILKTMKINNIFLKMLYGEFQI